MASDCPLLWPCTKSSQKKQAKVDSKGKRLAGKDKLRKKEVKIVKIKMEKSMWREKG
jgi:hypothetical protein